MLSDDCQISDFPQKKLKKTEKLFIHDDVVIDSPFSQAEESKGIAEVYAKEFFNLRASDKISLWRSLPDMRHPACQQKVYPKDLPTASVIFIFKNERWSPLLRSVYSVINRSPRHLLKEVILVDDVSDNGEFFSVVLVLFV